MILGGGGVKLAPPKDLADPPTHPPDTLRGVGGGVTEQFSKKKNSPFSLYMVLDA